MFECIAPDVWRYHDETGATSYLAVGRERAAMIDCGMGKRPVMPMIRAVTQLPVDLLLTHAHPDHYGAAGEFEHIWLHERDAAALPVFEAAFALLGAPALPEERLHTFAGSHVFDLGGFSLVAADLPGHTPGSAVFADEKNRLVFSGDAVGSGDIVLMSVPLADSLAVYRNTLRDFLQDHASWSDCRWLAGHCHQSYKGEGMPLNEPCFALVEDMCALCDALLNGSIQGEPVEERFAPEGKARRAYLGRAGIVYCDHQLHVNV